MTRTICPRLVTGVVRDGVEVRKGGVAHLCVHGRGSVDAFALFAKYEGSKARRWRLVGIMQLGVSAPKALNESPPARSRRALVGHWCPTSAAASKLQLGGRVPENSAAAG